MPDIYLYSSETLPKNIKLSIPTSTRSSETLPTIILQSETRLIISNETGFTTSTVIFQVNKDCGSWEARADGNGTAGSGLLVASGSNILANQYVSFNITYDELTNGDKVYPIDIFAHNSAGWSSRT